MNVEIHIYIFTLVLSILSFQSVGRSAPGRRKENGPRQKKFCVALADAHTLCYDIRYKARDGLERRDKNMADDKIARAYVLTWHRRDLSVEEKCVLQTLKFYGEPESGIGVTLIKNLHIEDIARDLRISETEVRNAIKTLEDRNLLRKNVIGHVVPYELHEFD